MTRHPHCLYSVARSIPLWFETKTRDILRRILIAICLSLIVLVPEAAIAHGDSGKATRLSRIGAAPDFTLVTQDGTTFSVGDLRGKVVAVNFIFTRCVDVCPLATHKMVGIQQKLGDAFGRDVFFISITVDPEHDTPKVLSEYADTFGCNLSGWAFLSGANTVVRDVAEKYGVVFRRVSGGETEHILLTSIIDREGILRVQYMGERFNPSEFLHDLRDLIDEKAVR